MVLATLSLLAAARGSSEKGSEEEEGSAEQGTSATTEWSRVPFVVQRGSNTITGVGVDRSRE